MIEFKTPETKPMLVPFISKDKTGIQIGGFQNKIARVIHVSDPKKFYDFLLQLNGLNTVADLAKQFDLPIDNILKILDTLQSNGVIFENDPAEFGFTSDEIQYYDRNLNFFEWIDTSGRYYNYWETQAKLKSSSVLLLGAGGTGSTCAESLARLGVGNIVILDMDKVELNNLNRQFYNPKEVGKAKAEALSKHLRLINPNISVSWVNKIVTDVNSLVSIGTSFSAVIDCIDKPVSITNTIDAYTKKYGVPWFLGSYASTILNTAFFDGTTPDYLSVVAESRKHDYEGRMLGKNKDWHWTNAIVAPIAAIGGNISALMCMYYLTGLKEIDPRKVQHIDFYNIQDLTHFSYILSYKKVDAFF